MELVGLKQVWNQVLDELERTNRVAWLVFFDARLVRLESNVLTLDFLDRTKLAAGHDFESHISAAQVAALTDAIALITGQALQVAVVD